MQGLKELCQAGYFGLLNLTTYKITFKLNSKIVLLREKNTKQIIINHKGTRKVKDGED